MKQRAIIYFLLFMFTAGLAIQACSLVGILVGSQIDKGRTNKDYEIPVGNIALLEEGELIELYFTDGSKKRGRFLSVELREDENGQIVEVIGLIKRKNSKYYETYLVDQIAQVFVLSPRRAATILGVLGGIVDVGVIVSFILYTEGLSAVFSPFTSSSCPYIYSYDGSSYILDAEPLGGAIWQNGERIDWELLNHMAEQDGAYLIRITNELQEIQHLNEVKLEVVDHPKGTAVYPDFDGTFHLIQKTVPPFKAYGPFESDFVNLVAEKDELFWISNPLNKNQLQEDERTSLTLEFKKPPEARQVKLHFNVQNTLWASNFIKEFLQLYGEELEGFYTGLNASTEQSEALIQLMIREGMLLVKLWDGEKWRDAGHLWGVGPLMAKDKVFEY